MKSRLVAGGHRQTPESYGRTTAPTVDISHVMLSLALVKKLQAKMATIDVAAAFLHAKLDEEIYMVLPKDVVMFLNQHDQDFRNNVSQGSPVVVVKLLKSLYGLKQSARNWHRTLKEFLRRQGFLPIQEVDACVFVRGSPEGQDLFIILTHVDDLLLISQDDGELKRFKRNMEKEFILITYHDNDISFLGMVVEQLETGDIFLSQPGYATKICKDEGSDKIYTTPGTATLFSDVDDQKEIYENDVTLYRSRLMSLMFLATRTRPDILKECTFLASFGCNPGEKSIKKLERIYGYVRNTIEYGIILGADSYRLKLYTDAAYALHANARSHTGVIITFDGMATRPVYCKSHVQKIVTLSSTESELVAMVEGVRRLIPLMGLLRKFGLANESEPAVILCA